MPKDDTDYKPSTLYGLSKVHGEQLVRAAASDLGTWTILRHPASGVPGSACHIATSSTRSSAAGTSTRPAETRKSNGHVENTVHQWQRLAACPPSEVHRRTFVVADYPAVNSVQSVGGKTSAQLSVLDQFAQYRSLA